MMIGALALIALLMGLFVKMPASNGSGAISCGHVLDPAYRHGATKPACAAPLRKRRVEVAAAAGVAGAAAIVGVAAAARALSSSS